MLLLATGIFVLFAFFRGTGEEKEGDRKPDHEKPDHDEVTEDLVTVASYFHPGLAHVAKGKLESEGIDCYLANEVLGSLWPQYMWADGGVHLRVRESDVPKARELLSGDEADETETMACDQCGTIVEESDKFCPGCGEQFS